MHRRSGFACVPAFREVLLLSLALTAVLALMWQASVSFQSHLTSQWPQTKGDVKAVLAVSIDQDEETLVTLTWPGVLETISLVDAASLPQRVNTNLVSAVCSSTNSVIVMLSEWCEDSALHHRVDILRHNEGVFAEEFIFEPSTSASVCVSGNGQIAMIVNADGQAIGWDFSGPEVERWELKFHHTTPRCRLSADGNSLVIAPLEQDAFVCDSRTGAVKVRLTEFKNACDCRSLDWSGDGKLIAISDAQGGVHVFETEHGTRIAHHEIDFEFARTVAISHDGLKLAAGGFDNIIRVWDLSSPSQPPMELKGQGGVIRCMTFSPSNATLISGSLDGSLHEWSLASGDSTRKFR